jgi:release factor glutamine methyltransferase
VLTIGELLAQTVEVTGDISAARWICEVAVGLDGDEFRAGMAEPVTTAMVAHLDAMVQRWKGGEPLQYVLGRWSFRYLDLAVDARALIPRPETELVAGVALELAQQVHDRTRSVTVVDLGTGSGAIGLALAHELPLVGTTVWLSDIDADALDLARANLAGLGRCAVNVRIAEGSWFEALPTELLADVIVANPPYIAEGDPEVEKSVHGHEPQRALYSGADGLEDLRTIIAGARDHLVEGGWLVLEIGAGQGAEVGVLLEAAGLTEVEVRPDLAGRDRIAVARSPLMSGRAS